MSEIIALRLKNGCFVTPGQCWWTGSPFANTEGNWLVDIADDVGCVEVRMSNGLSSRIVPDAVICADSVALHHREDGTPTGLSWGDGPEVPFAELHKILNCPAPVLESVDGFSEVEVEKLPLAETAASKIASAADGEESVWAGAVLEGMSARLDGITALLHRRKVKSEKAIEDCRRMDAVDAAAARLVEIVAGHVSTETLEEIKAELESEPPRGGGETLESFRDLLHLPHDAFEAAAQERLGSVWPAERGWFEQWRSGVATSTLAEANPSPAARRANWEGWFSGLGWEAVHRSQADE